MSLDEAIKYYSYSADECRRKARIERNDYMDLKDLAAEHEQLADWLNELKVLREKIQKLLEKQEKDGWILVSEALPEDYTDVLVWFEYFRYGDYNCMYQTYGIGTYSARYDSWMINHESGWHKLRVIAWRPLPEPYQEDKA